jgi:Domain of unknown function (DUF4124)
MKYLVLLFLALNPLSLQAGELFRWVDNDGKVHYGDALPAKAAQVERKKFSDAAQPNMDIPYETRLAQKNFPVILYVADNCKENCTMARSLLLKRGIPYSERNLKSKADIDAFKALSGTDSVPALGVGRHYLSGFLAEQWHGELDIAGYPKTSGYRAALPASAPASTATVGQ